MNMQEPYVSRDELKITLRVEPSFPTAVFTVRLSFIYSCSVLKI